MIISNGYIYIKAKEESGIDPATGFPKKPTSRAFSAPIPCQYIVNSYNRLGNSNGNSFTIAQYDILIEEPAEGFYAENIKLTDASDYVLGEFAVRSIERLEAVGQIRLIV